MQWGKQRQTSLENCEILDPSIHLSNISMNCVMYVVRGGAAVLRVWVGGMMRDRAPCSEQCKAMLKIQCISTSNLI